MPTLTTTADLEASLDHLRAAPADTGKLEMVVRRPDTGVREILDEGVLDETRGLVGDNWLSRATSRAMADGRHFDAMITVMSARMIGLLGDTAHERALAGDQLFVDLDISDDAVLEVTAKPHAGCKKFLTRFGEDALAFVNGEVGSRLRMRGLNARVVHGGVVRPGDAVSRIR